MKPTFKKKKPLQVLWHIIKVTHFSKFILSFVCYLFLAALILFFTEPAIKTFGDSIWYCFVTSTTTGYGDIVVTTAIGRIVSVILALYGLLFFGCLSGIVVTYYMEMNKLLPQEDDQK
ncbi:potassium channel family protein [Streptococcus dentapri]|uniref:Potassium channel family protein n=1 Tax=Streptococcus dentapri TaxID=573564 RepID=A0ABV8D1J0_9STRE